MTDELEPIGYDGHGAPLYAHQIDALNDPAHVVPPPPPPPGRHRAELESIYLAAGETCLECSSTALVGHWHGPTDCSVARTGWGGP